MPGRIANSLGIPAYHTPLYSQHFCTVNLIMNILKFKTMKNFTVPTRGEVSEKNQTIFDTLQKTIGFVPNLLAYFAKSETALDDYLTLQNRKSTLRKKEIEVINLVTSQINGCRYCQSAHTAIGKLNGFSDEQIIEIRQGSASFDAKLNALAKFTSSVVENRGHASQQAKDAFFATGYTEANMIDVVITIGDMTISRVC